MKKFRGYSSVRELSKWVKWELKHRKGEGEYRNNDNTFLIQFITTEFDRMWKAIPKKWLSLDDIKILISKSPKTGHKEWDELFTGIVEYYCNVKFNIPHPKWIKNTSLERRFNPYNSAIENNSEYCLDIVDTPQELFKRNVILPRVNFNHV
jgi:hypothetical protein